VTASAARHSAVSVSRYGTWKPPVAGQPARSSPNARPVPGTSPPNFAAELANPGAVRAAPLTRRRRLRKRDRNSSVAEVPGCPWAGDGGGFLPTAVSASPTARADRGRRPPADAVSSGAYLDVQSRKEGILFGRLLEAGIRSRGGEGRTTRSVPAARGAAVPPHGGWCRRRDPVLDLRHVGGETIVTGERPLGAAPL
jgi:hypothetical protein